MGITRGVDVDLLASLETSFNPVVLVYINWPDGAVRAHNSVGTITVFGEDWLGVSYYGDISVPEESSSISNPTATLILSSSLASLLGELNKDPRNSTVEMYFGTTTTRGGSTLTGTPVKIFTGYVDGIDFDFSRDGDAASSSIAVTVASGPSPRAFASITHTEASQKYLYPTDTAGEKVINYSKKRINPDVWPEP